MCNKRRGRLLPMTHKLLLLLLHRKGELHDLLSVWVQVRANDRERLACSPHGCERAEDHGNPAQDLGSPNGDQVRGTGPHADGVQLHRPGSSPQPCARRRRALTIETATGVPPFRPRFVMYGTSSWLRSSAFDSAAATNPTGTPITRLTFASPCLISRTSSTSAVGALPMT